jgi:D-sedoheptulose 7-phosphate isomerase
MSENKTELHLKELMTRYPQLNPIRDSILDAYRVLENCYAKGGKLMIAGNGGSAADAEHIAGELMKRFRRPRHIPAGFEEALLKTDPVRGTALAAHLERSLPAIPLVSHEALITAYMNDADAAGVFAQQLYGYGRPGDVFLAISTSGNSENILNAAVVAKAVGIATIGLTGGTGGKLAEMADVSVIVPEAETYRIQELHLPIYHCWCMMLEEEFFGTENR